MTNETIDPEIMAGINAWLSGSYDEKTKEEIRTLLAQNPKELSDAFYKSLSFGSGGMRCLMGVGTNRMNLYSVQKAAQGFASYLLGQSGGNPTSVFISYDTRLHSKEFAEAAAKVFAGNGIKVYLTTDIAPSPLVSFACRFKKCSGGIMITASHNPKEYNGFKVYGPDGAQVLPPQELKIEEEVNKTHELSQVKSVDALQNPLIEKVGDEVDDAYLESIKTVLLHPEEDAKSGSTLKIVYTSMHGTGITLVPRALRLAGFSSLFFVETQITPDGTFPTLSSPNPEHPECLSLGLETLQKKEADILIATDADADRIGTACWHEGKPYLLTGNQMACILAEHICRSLVDQEKLKAQDCFIKTIVTSELFRAIITRYDGKCFDVLPGFKYIAELIRTWEEQKNDNLFIFGGEESFGYLKGTVVRDKDGISTSNLIAEVALAAKQQGKTLVNLLHDIYDAYGIYWDKILTLPFPDNKEGQEQIKTSIEKLRKNGFNEIGGKAITKIDDYLTSQSQNPTTKTTSPLPFPPYNLLVYWLEDGSKLMVRPSGTEPKIKIYCEIVQKEYEEIRQGEEAAEARAAELVEALKELLTANPPIV